MMDILFLRSSSYNCHEMCPFSYFIEYVLGWRGPSNKKADKGTIVHKVLEVLAKIKQSQQNKKNFYKDDICGHINIKKYILIHLIDTIYKYYTHKFNHHHWLDVDYTDCVKWVHKALDFNNGQFNPLNRTIIDAEPHFNFEIEKPWALNQNGFLRLKGTIDLVTKIDDNTYEIIDWKTGRRLNWATGEEKTHEKLLNDPQLRIYHYAAYRLYNIEQIVVTIFFINDGGPFPICFNKNDLSKTEDIIKTKYLEIQQDTNPYLNKTWKCSKFCFAGTTTFANTDIKPMIEFRKNQNTEMGSQMTKCEQIAFELNKFGMDNVLLKYTKPDHTLGHYEEPGN